MTQFDHLPVITISREYGAGGRTIAKALSETLNIPWYDKDFIRKTSEESGYSIEDIQKDGEELKNSSRILDKFLDSATPYTSIYAGIFKAQKETIFSLSSDPCIIVGRGANIILAEAGIPSFDVFLYADMEHRMKRAAELKENGTTELSQYVKERDEFRNTYYRTYLKRDLGNCDDYDLILNTGIFDTNRCIELILEALKLKG